MSLARIPLPSIAFVLTADHSSLPSRPSVIKFEFDPLKTIRPTSSGRRCKLDPVGIQIDSIDDQTDKSRAVDERFFFHIVDDSGHSEGEPLDDDEPDARTTFAEQRPTTSRGPKSKGLTNDAVLKHNLRAMASTIRRASTIRSILWQFKPKGSAIIQTVINEE